MKRPVAIFLRVSFLEHYPWCGGAIGDNKNLHSTYTMVNRDGNMNQRFFCHKKPT